jgi:hypothetical protein
MKILKITNQNIGGEKIVVELENYPHAQPVFPADTKAADLPALLQAWKKNQDEVDAINAAALAAPKPVPVVAKELLDMVGKVIADNAEAPK